MLKYVYMYTVHGSSSTLPSGLDLNHLDEREGLVALCCRHEWFAGKRRTTTRCNELRKEFL